MNKLEDYIKVISQSGGGSLQFNISEKGRLRPCQLLPKEYFDMGGLEVLTDIIEGKHGFDLVKSTQNTLVI